MTLTEDQINQLKHISTEEIRKDLSDTQREKEQFEKELTALEGNRQGNKLQIYMTEGKISQRQEFINKLNQVLEYRNNNNQP